MKTILVPTDFSSSAKKAAQYALDIAAQLQSSKVVFFNAFQAPPIITEPSMPAISYIDTDSLKKISETSMMHFEEEMRGYSKNNIQIETKVEFATLSDEINEVCEKEGANLIIMGITGASKIEEVLMGSTALSVMKNTKIPLIIVPSDNTHSAINNVMLMTDLKNVVETTPVDNIQQLLETTKAKLHIVNLYEKEKEITDEKNHQQELLGNMLQPFNPQFHVLHCDHFIEGVNDFVKQNHIDLIIAIPKKHGFFADFFKERHTKKLAFHTHIPLVYVHNEDL